MIACTDVYYGQTQAIAACLLFRHWSDDHPSLELTERIQQPAPYEPGRFYRRELPGLLSVIERVPVRPGVIIIDGYVWLGDEFHPGLGAYLYEARGRAAATAVRTTARTTAAVILLDVGFPSYRAGPYVRIFCSTPSSQESEAQEAASEVVIPYCHSLTSLTLV